MSNGNGFPYWQFHNDRWLTGKIASFDLDEQGLFLQFCMAAWAAHGLFNVCSTSVGRRFRKPKAWTDSTVAAFEEVGIMVRAEGGYRIKFIDDQLADLDDIRGKRSKAGRASADARGMARNTESREEESEKSNKRREEKSSVLKSVQHDLNTCSTHVEPIKEPIKGKKAFTPPTLEEVRGYLVERASSVDPELFHAHYEANGWVQGNRGKPVKNWKACVVTWEKGARSKASNRTPVAPLPYSSEFIQVYDLWPAAGRIEKPDAWLAWQERLPLIVRAAGGEDTATLEAHLSKRLGALLRGLEDRKDSYIPKLASVIRKGGFEE